MKAHVIIFSLALVSSLIAFAVEPDLLVTQNGESFKVYNLDLTSGDNVYYTLSDESNAPLHKISKKDVLIIKKSDGIKIDPMTNHESSSIKSATREMSQIRQAYSPQIYHAIEDGFVTLKFNATQGMAGSIIRKGIAGSITKMKQRYYSYHQDMPRDEHLARFIIASDEMGSILNFRLVSDKEKTLAVSRPRAEKQVKQSAISRMEYEKSDYSIPDYVMIGDIEYSVVEIDPFAFQGKTNIKSVTFPETLRLIGPMAFEGCRLNRIILPNSIEIVGDMAFFNNYVDDFEEIYIPKGIKEIGRDCFRLVGSQCSPRGFTEAYLSSVPDFITTDNCTEFGIDDNALELYEQ